MADDGAHQRGLADAVAAHDASDLTDLGGDRDASQGLGGAVMEVDGIHSQHEQLSRRMT